jgi:hypothetical protein
MMNVAHLESARSMSFLREVEVHHDNFLCPVRRHMSNNEKVLHSTILFRQLYEACLQGCHSLSVS